MVKEKETIYSNTKLFIINPNRMVGIEKFPDGSYRKVKYVRDTRKLTDKDITAQKKPGVIELIGKWIPIATKYTINEFNKIIHLFKRE